MTLQIQDIRMDRSVSTRAILSTGPAFRDGVAYLRVADRPNVVYEFIKRGRRWLCVGMGRRDRAEYAGLFSTTPTQKEDA